MSRFPYHHCAAIGCTEMTPPSVLFCPTHALTALDDDHFFPEVEDDFADASQLPRTEQPAAPGAAESQETPNP